MQIWTIRAIYTFVDRNGMNTHIDVQGLREWCLGAGLEVFLGPVTQEHAEKIIADNAVALERVEELLRRAGGGEKFDPIIMCKDGGETNGAPDVMLVDGHHRYVLTALAGLAHINTWLLEESQWRPWQLHGLPSVTQEELVAMPILPRRY